MIEICEECRQPLPFQNSDKYGHKRVLDITLTWTLETQGNRGLSFLITVATSELSATVWTDAIISTDGLRPCGLIRYVEVE